jgi:replicative DNA helicase
MFNVQAAVLKMLLLSKDRNLALNAFSRLKKHFFSDAFTSIYTAVQSYYTKHSEMPTLDSLVLEASRNTKLSQALSVLSMAQLPDADLDLAISVLEDEFTQNEALRLIKDELLIDLTFLDKSEIINRMSSMAFKLEEKVTASDKVYNANHLKVFSNAQVQQLNLIPLGLSNTWDNVIGGVARSEVIFIGGYRGTGKSVVCSNMQINQYSQDKIAPYFTIEMKAEEVFKRNLAIMAGVSALDIRNQSLVGSELIKLARTRADMFHGGAEFLTKYMNSYSVDNMSHFDDMENELNDRFSLKTDMIIIHDRELTTAAIDVQISTLKARYGDKLTLGIVDYLNQVKVEGSVDMYDWKDQMIVAKQLKNCAGKHDVGLAVPIQVDADGKTRLSQGIMDACDIAINLNAAKADNGQGAIIFECTKARSLPEMTFSPAMNWNTLKIDATKNLTDQDIEDMQAKLVIVKDKPKAKKKAKESAKADDSEARDLDI